MLRPRDSHDLRIIDASFVFSPPGAVSWAHDVFGNSIAHAMFLAPATELWIESRLRVEQCGDDSPPVSLDPEAMVYPFAYSAEDCIDLGQLRTPHYNDRSRVLASWAESFVQWPRTNTLALLSDINTSIRAQHGYQTRDEYGTQTPLETLRRGWGSCRDFAVLLAEAARSLGFGARVVTGYLYVPDADGTIAQSFWGGGATHAWAEVYLPGAGWVAFDPTNGTCASTDLVRVAVARDISQIVPISGSYTGVPDDCLGMTVTASVTCASR